MHTFYSRPTIFLRGSSTTYGRDSVQSRGSSRTPGWNMFIIMLGRSDGRSGFAGSLGGARRAGLIRATSALRGTVSLGSNTFDRCAIMSLFFIFQKHLPWTPRNEPFKPLRRVFLVICSSETAEETEWLWSWSSKRRGTIIPVVKHNWNSSIGT